MSSEKLPLLRKAPPDRSEEALRNHFLIERAIARRLMKGTAEDRKRIYATMYDELFAKVPDHPRLMRREDPGLTRRTNAYKMALVKPFLRKQSHVGEFGAGDCQFAIRLSDTVERVYAIDIADQSAGRTDQRANLELIVYDGYKLPLEDDSLDLMISDQLLEHLHPDDVRNHFQIVRRVLKPGGQYLLRTPHRFLGPHDISKYFSDEAEGFHLKEWTYRELCSLISEAGFRSVHSLRSFRGKGHRVPSAYFTTAERILSWFPRSWQRRIGRVLLKEVLLIAVK